MEFRRRGSGLALRVIRAGPPEFAGFQPAGATRPVKRFWAEVMEGRDRCSAFLGVLGVLAVSLFSISLNATWYHTARQAFGHVAERGAGGAAGVEIHYAALLTHGLEQMAIRGHEA